MEYLLFAPQAGFGSEYSSIIEEGFISAAESATMGLDAAVCASNSLGLVDLPRLHTTKEMTGVAASQQRAPEAILEEKRGRVTIMANIASTVLIYRILHKVHCGDQVL